MGEHKSLALLSATGIIVLAFILVLLFFGGKSTLDNAEKTVDKNWLNIFTKSAQINSHLADLTQQAKATKVAPEHINSQFEDIYQETRTNQKLFATANSPQKILTLVQNIDQLIKRYKEIGFTVENYPALEIKQTYLAEYYVLLDQEKELRLLIREYRDSLDYYNNLLETFPLSYAAGNETALISHFDREY